MLIVSVLGLSANIHRAFAAGTVCIGPDLPGQTACPAATVAFTGPVTTSPSTQLRVQVFLQGSDPMNGADIVVKADPAVLNPVGVDFTGTLYPPGFTILAECINGALIAGSTCDPTTDRLGTIHVSMIGFSGGLSPSGETGLLWTGIFNIVGASAGSTIDYQTNAGTTTGNGCTTGASFPATCVRISDGTTTPVPVSVQTASFTSSTTQPYLQLSPGSTTLGNAFPGSVVPPQTLTTTDNNGYGPWQNNGGVPFNGDTTITYSVAVIPPTQTATGVSATIGAPNPQDFAGSTGAGFSVTNTIQVTNTATSTPGFWTIQVLGTYHFDPNCVQFVGCPGPASTLAETVTYTLNIEDFGFTVGGSTTNLFLPFWCPATTQGAACPAGQSGVANVVVTSLGYTGAVALGNGAVSPVTSPVLTATMSPTSIPGASGTATDTYTGGLLRPLATTGQYVVSATGTGTLAANGAFPLQTKVKSVSVIVRPQAFNITTSNGTPTGPAISFNSGSSATDTLTIGSLPSGSAAVNSAGFTGPVTLSSTITGGSGLVVTPTTNPVTLTAGLKLTDVVTFSGSVGSTTTFSVTITGTATLASSTPTTLTRSVTYSVTINGGAHPTTTTVTCTTPVVINQGSTCNVTVTDNAASGATTPTRNVSLNQTGVTGSFTTCTLARTTASATCTSTFTASTSGTAAVTASYPGDAGHAASSGTTSIVVNPRATTTTVSCTTPVVINQGSTCNVTVTDVSAGTAITPTGTVALSQTGVTGSFTTCTLAGTTASATCTSTFTASTSGTAAVTASYPGDTTHASSSGTTSIVVNKRTTTTTVSCTTPVVINQGSTCNVTVTDTSAGTFITPTGTVALSETGVTGTFTTCTLAGTTASATCTSTFTASTSGTAAVTASYPVDTAHSSSTGTTSIVVNPLATATTVNCTTPVVINQGSTCNVTVTDPSPGTAIPPTGTVVLSQTGVTGSFTTCPLAGTTASATCTSTFTASTSGTAAVTASYPGDTTHASSSGTTSIVVNKRTTTTTISCSTPVVINQGSTCTVTVTDTSATGATTPTGTVALSETGVTGTFTTCTLSGTTASATCTST